MSTIRSLRSEDCQGIAAWMLRIPLWQRYGLTEEAIRNNFEQAMQRSEMLFVAEDESGEVCGFAWCVLGGAFARSAYLRLIGVHPDYSGHGLGRILLDYVEAQTRQAGVDLFLLVSDFNVDAQRFYQRQGYQQVGAIPGYVLNDVAELIYYKKLSAAS